MVNLVFKGINDQTRRDILDLLKEKDMNAGDIAAHFNMSKPSISHHLDILKQADLVTSVKEGQFIIYSINTTVIDELFQWVLNFKEALNEKKNYSGDSISNTSNLSNRLSNS